MGLLDRDYAKERKLDYTSKYDKKVRPIKLPTFASEREQGDLPKWVFVVGGVSAVGLFLVLKYVVGI